MEAFTTPIQMVFSNLVTARTTMMAACLANAEKNGWNMDFNITEGKYYWESADWWPQMARFILTCEVDEAAINKWGVFDKLDVGLSHVHGKMLRLSTFDTGMTFKRYVAVYFMRERLRC